MRSGIDSKLALPVFSFETFPEMFYKISGLNIYQISPECFDIINIAMVMSSSG